MRIFNTETVDKIGQEVELKGWVNARRDMGKITFWICAIVPAYVQVWGVPSELDENRWKK